MMKQYYENLYKETTRNNDRMQLIEEANAEADQGKSGIIFSEKLSALKPKSEQWSVSSVELECIKKKLNNKKSCISNYIIKKCPKIFWDITRSIPKTAAAAAPKDFRPISMVSNWGKLLEKVIMVKMKNEDGHIKGVPDNQFAYRMGHSAVHAADLVCADARNTRRRGRTTAVVELDATKAFDSVWRKGLIYKLKANGEHMNVNNFMKGRTAVVKLGEVLSLEFALGRGVPQGSKLGPVLYNIYTGDIDVVQSVNQGSANYADDFLFWCSSRFKPGLVKTVQKEVDGLKKELEKWDIIINEEKTNLLVVGAENMSGRMMVKQLKKVGVELGSRKKIRASSTIKYLGITINEDLKPNDAINHAVNKGFAVY